MRFPFKFERRVGAGILPVLGTDSAPLDHTDLADSNVFKTKLPGSEVDQQLAIGYEYTGVGVPLDLACQCYLYDGTSRKWFTVDELGTTIKAGDIAFLPLLQLIDEAGIPGVDPYETSVDTLEIALVVSAAGGDPDGTYTFLMGSTMSGGVGSGGSSSSTATGGSVGGGNNIWSNPQDFTATANAGAKTITFAAYASTILSAGVSTLNFTAAVIKRISTTGVVDTLPTTNVAFLADVLTLADMTAVFAAGDRVLVFVPGPDKAYDQTNDAARSGGLVADDAVAVGNPLLLGAKYVADIFASVVAASGNMAGLVTDQFRRLHVRPAGYDSVGDGIRALIASSLAEPQPIDMSQTAAAADGPYAYYIDVDDYKYLSLQWSVTAGTSDKILTVLATNQDDGTAPASCTYIDVTLDWFGAASFSVAGAATGVKSLEVDTPATWRYVKVNVQVGSVTAGANNTWLLYGRKQRM